jgi:hypothetical protein
MKLMTWLNCHPTIVRVRADTLLLKNSKHDIKNPLPLTFIIIIITFFFSHNLKKAKTKKKSKAFHNSIQFFFFYTVSHKNQTMVAATPTPNNHHCPHNMSVLEKEQDASTKCTSPTKSSTKSSMKSSTNNSNNNNNNNNNNKDDNKDDNANKIAKKNKKNNSKKRRVQFFPKCFAKHTISRHDMTDKEIQATWIQQNEEKAIRRRCQQLIKNASGHNSNSDSDNSDDESMRGLEDIKQRRWNRQIAQDEVFDEQDRQDIDYDYNKGRGYNYNNAGLNDTNNNNNDDERIASVYKEYTLKCTISARIMAIKDRNDIENYIMVLQH